MELVKDKIHRGVHCQVNKQARLKFSEQAWDHAWDQTDRRIYVQIRDRVREQVLDQIIRITYNTKE